VGIFDRLRRRPAIDRFAADLMRAMRAAGDTSDLRYEPDERRIIRSKDGGSDQVTSLANMFRSYSEASPKDRPEHLRRFVRVALNVSRELPAEFEDARPDLRPKIWTRDGIEAIRLRALLGGPGGGLEKMRSEPLGEHVVLSLVYD
jgi:hypothetical protein